MCNFESLIITYEISKKDEPVLIVGREKGEELEAINMFCGKSAREIYDMLVTVTDNN